MDSLRSAEVLIKTIDDIEKWMFSVEDISDTDDLSDDDDFDGNSGGGDGGAVTMLEMVM